jgi:glycosyltransferase involved in cell wall biosynthesis
MLTAEKFRLPLEKMVVIYNGVNEQFIPMDRRQAQSLLADKYHIDSPFVLYAGKLQSRKNIIRILQAFDIVRRDVRPDLKLVLAGRRTWKSEGLDETMDRLNVRDKVIELGYIRNDDLPLLYSGAEVFVFPSLWEGFGIPVIEAMACGTPVVTSNISSLPEVAGDAALLVDPYSINDIAAAMERLLSDGELRQRLHDKGLERVKAFSWRNTALRTRQLYETLSGI